MTQPRVRVVVAMSGGVDSSVAAALVARAGYEAVGVTLRLLPKLETGFGCCGSPRDIEDAKRVCELLGISHYVLDIHELFEHEVIGPFVREYMRSRTPNPCVECNRNVKFGYLLGLARAWNAERLATGHYARAEGGRLYRALDPKKDQSYFLYSLTRRELNNVLFPVGGLQKPEVRRIAQELALPTADKPESQEICFVPNRDYRAFLRSNVAEVGSEGPIRDTGGRLLGRHSGLENYTIGQRRGLGVPSSSALYVTGMDAETRTLYVGAEPQTYQTALMADRVSWTQEAPRQAVDVEVRIRHRATLCRARLTVLEEETPSEGGARVRVELERPQKAVTPGQAVVFYEGEEVLGGGTISDGSHAN